MFKYEKNSSPPIEPKPRTKRAFESWPLTAAISSAFRSRSSSVRLSCFEYLGALIQRDAGGAGISGEHSPAAAAGNRLGAGLRIVVDPSQNFAVNVDPLLFGFEQAPRGHGSSQDRGPPAGDVPTAVGLLVLLDLVDAFLEREADALVGFRQAHFAVYFGQQR